MAERIVAALDRPSTFWTARMTRISPGACAALLAATLACANAAAAAAEPLPYPPAPRQPVIDIYHGISVTDDYRWLEDTGAPAVRTWIAQQNALTRSVLDGSPKRAAIFAELSALLGQAPTTRYDFRYAGGRLFALKRQPPANQPRLVVLRDPRDLASETVVLDPNVLDPNGTTAIDWYVPSHDGRTVAVSLSEKGSELGALHFFDAGSGRALPDVVARVQAPTGGGSVAWAAGNRGVYYTRYPQGSERPAADANFHQQVWFHKLGTPASADRYVIGKDFPRIAEIALDATDDGRHLLAKVSNGDGGEEAFWLRSPAGRWDRIAGFGDGVKSIRLGRDGRWYALVLKGSARGRIVAAPLSVPSLARAVVVVPEGADVIDEVTPTAHRLYVGFLAGGPQELRAFTLEGEALGPIGHASIAKTQVGVALDGDSILFGSQSFVSPFAWYRFEPSATTPMPEPTKTMLSEAPKNHGMDEVEVRREFAVSKDGTKIPLNIVSRKGLVLDGSHPTLLTAYGGYGLSMQPYFSLRNAFWLRHGGVFVLANVRGGGEYGEDWHTAGNLTKKQNVFDDFIASAGYLVDKGYTSPKKLAIQGGSNGGLLMGAALVQRPELFRAVVSHVGIYDMLRVELSPNGAFNVTEFGSVKDPAQFRALYAYSPIHHVVDGTAYPAVMLLTGLHDGRVEPHHSLRMAARLQAASSSGKPVLLRVAGDAGHGQGMALSSVIAQDADVETFLFEQLGMD
jgi:prolyl oligopeptidase